MAFVPGASAVLPTLNVKSGAQTYVFSGVYAPSTVAVSGTSDAFFCLLLDLLHRHQDFPSSRFKTDRTAHINSHFGAAAPCAPSRVPGPAACCAVTSSSTPSIPPSRPSGVRLCSSTVLANMLVMHIWTGFCCCFPPFEFVVGETSIEPCTQLEMSAKPHSTKNVTVTTLWLPQRLQRFHSL